MISVVTLVRLVHVPICICEYSSMPTLQLLIFSKKLTELDGAGKKSIFVLHLSKKSGNDMMKV